MQLVADVDIKAVFNHISHEVLPIRCLLQILQAARSALGASHHEVPL